MKLLCTKDYYHDGELWFKKWNHYVLVAIGSDEEHDHIELYSDEMNGPFLMNLEDLEQSFNITLIEEEAIAEQKKKPTRRRGRPLGSKNKPKPKGKYPTPVASSELERAIYDLTEADRARALWERIKTK